MPGAETGAVSGKGTAALPVGLEAVVARRDGGPGGENPAVARIVNQIGVGSTG